MEFKKRAIPALEVAGLSVRLKNEARSLLKEITFTLPQGARLAIIGPNGAGKSTLLKALLGLCPAEFTTCSLLGSPLRELTLLERAKKSSYIAQQSEIAQWTTVYEWCEFSRYAMEQSGMESLEGKEAIEDALKAVNAWQFRHRELCSLSGGERQRALFAGALAQETPLIFLDEPSAAFDPKVKQEFYRWLSDFKQKTFLVVTHDFQQLAQNYTHILGLKAGKIAFFGKTQEVLKIENLNALFEVEFQQFKEGDAEFFYLR